MNTETLNIKISVDASQAKKQVNDMKTSLNSLKSTNGINNLSTGFNNLGKTAKTSLSSITSMVNTLNSSFIGSSALSSITNAVAGFQTLKQSMSFDSSDIKETSIAMEGLETAAIAGASSMNSARINTANLRKEQAVLATAITAAEKKLEGMSSNSIIGRATKNAIADAKLQLQDMNKTIDEIGGNASGWIDKIGSKTIKTIGSIVAAIALVKNAITVAANGDEIKDEAQKVYMATDAYQEWGYVLKQNGVDMSVLGTAMRTFSKNFSTGAFEGYGISGEDVGKGFEDAIAYCQSLTSETERVTAAVELFGSRAANQLMPVLNMTNAETQSLMNTYRYMGATMNDSLVANSDRLTDTILQMKMAWQGLKNQLAVAIIPVLTQIVYWLSVIITAATRAIMTIYKLVSSVVGVVRGWLGVKSATDSSNKSINKSVKATGSTASNLGKAAKAAKQIKRYLAGFDELNVYSKTASGGTTGGTGSIGGIDLGDLDGSVLDDLQLPDFEKFKKDVEACIGPLETLVGFILAITGHPVIGITLMILGITDMVQQVFDWIAENKNKTLTAELKLVKEEGLFKGIIDSIKKEWKDFVDNWDWSSGVDFDALKKKLRDAFKIDFTPTISAEFELVKKDGLFNGVIESIKTEWKEFISNWDWSSGVDFSGIKDKFKEAISNGIGNIASLSLDIKVSVGNIYEAVKDSWTKANNWAKKKKIKIKIAVSATVSNIKSFINSKVIKPLNSKIKSVFKGFKGIPLLAKGGVLTAPTVAMMGEYPGAKSNPEIATPQSLLYETITSANGDMVGAFAQMTRQVIQAIEANETIITIGDETIARSAQRGNQSYKRRTGQALFNY